MKANYLILGPTKATNSILILEKKKEEKERSYFECGPWIQP